MSQYPSFEEGRPRRSNKATLPHEIGAAGEVSRLSLHGLTSPAVGFSSSEHNPATMLTMRWGRSFDIGPHGQFVSVGIGKMKPAAAWKRKDVFDDFASGIRDLLL